MAEGRFDWYERVRVASADPAKAAIDGQLGTILGKARGDDGRCYGWCEHRPAPEQQHRLLLAPLLSVQLGDVS